MRKMDVMTVSGLLIGLILIFVAISLGGSVLGYIDAPSILITIFGSFSALVTSYSLERIKGAVKIAKVAFYVKQTNAPVIIEKFATLSIRARREGLLALEEEKEALNDPFFERGIQMVVDGMEPEVIREIMETEVFYIEDRHAEGQGVFKTWATYAPAFGMMGTLIGLVQMLRDLDDPSKIGPAMAIALLTTFYGVLLANLILLPIAAKLSLNSKAEILEKQIILEGILAIQSGINPRIIEDKLKVFLSPQEREASERAKAQKQEGGVSVNAT